MCSQTGCQVEFSFIKLIINTNYSLKHTEKHLEQNNYEFH